MTTTKKSRFNKKERTAFGQVGGKALAKKVGKKGMSSLGKKGSAARWAGHDKCKVGRSCRHLNKKA